MVNSYNTTIAPQTPTAFISASAQANPPNQDGLNNLREADKGKVRRVASNIRKNSNYLDIDRPTKIRQLKPKLTNFVIVFGKPEALHHQIYLNVDPDEMNDKIDRCNKRGQRCSQHQHWRNSKFNRLTRNRRSAGSTASKCASVSSSKSTLSCSKLTSSSSPAASCFKSNQLTKNSATLIRQQHLGVVAITPFRPLRMKLTLIQPLQTSQIQLLRGQLDSNVVRTEAGLTLSNDNYKALVDFNLKESTLSDYGIHVWVVWSRKTWKLDQLAMNVLRQFGILSSWSRNIWKDIWILQRSSCLHSSRQVNGGAA